MTIVLHYITILYMNQTIYFRKDVWEKFQSVEDKSKLINELLEQFYTPSQLPKIINKPKDVAKYVKSDMKLCKNGHPIPEGRSRCLGRGCKYS